MFKKNVQVTKVNNEEATTKSEAWVTNVTETGEAITRCAHEAEADIMVIRMAKLTVVICDKCAINLTARCKMGVLD